MAGLVLDKAAAIGVASASRPWHNATKQHLDNSEISAMFEQATYGVAHSGQ